MSETASVIDLDARRRRTSSTAGKEPPERVIARGRILDPTEQSQKSNASIEIENLYAPDTPTGALIYNARRILNDAEKNIIAAQALQFHGDVFGSDNEISLLQAEIPELFGCSNALSDGFGATVVAIHHALRNRRGQPLSIDQIYSLRKTIEALRGNPFIEFDSALDLIDHLIDAGFKTDPQEANDLSAILPE